MSDPIRTVGKATDGAVVGAVLGAPWLGATDAAVVGAAVGGTGVAAAEQAVMIMTTLAAMIARRLFRIIPPPGDPAPNVGAAGRWSRAGFIHPRRGRGRPLR